jgi:hypothetical protein
MTIVANVLLMNGCLAAMAIAVAHAQGDTSVRTAASLVLYGVLAAVSGLSAYALMRQRARSLQTFMIITNGVIVPLAMGAFRPDMLTLPVSRVSFAVCAIIAAAAGVVNALTLCFILRADARLALS